MSGQFIGRMEDDANSLTAEFPMRPMPAKGVQAFIGAGDMIA